MRASSLPARRGAIAALLTLSACTAIAGAAPVDYVIDDGGGNFNIGPSQFDAWTTWGNVFEAQPGGETITDISVSFAGSLPAGTEFSVGIWQLNNMFAVATDSFLLSRTDGLLSETTGYIGDTGLNEFASYDVADTVVSGQFFVGIIMYVPQGQAAARMDEDTHEISSWLFYDDANDADLTTKPYAQQMAGTPFNGTWMIRAHGVPTPGAAAVLGLAGLAATRRRR